MSFGGGGQPQPQPVPVAPLVDPVQVANQAKQAEDARNKAASSVDGRASTILTGALGAPTSPGNIAVKTLGGG